MTSPLHTQGGDSAPEHKRVEAQISILEHPLTGYASYPDSKEVVPAAFAHELAAQAAHHSAQLEKALGRIDQLEGALQQLISRTEEAAWIAVNEGQADQHLISGAYNTAKAALPHPDSTKKS